MLTLLAVVRPTLAGLATLGLACSLQAQTLTVSAAASLTNAMQAIGQAYEKAHPGSQISFNFAASGPLLAQIQQGAPVDVFASADQETMNRAAAAKLLADDTRANFAQNTLVVIVPSGAAKMPQSLADLGGADFKRIATGTPVTVPVGRYTMEAVHKAGLAEALAPRWIFGENVRQVLNYVARGEVDAGFVYRTDALIEPGKTRIAFTAPTSTPVSYPIAAVAASKDGAGARKFIDFVRSSSGTAILEKFGFSKP